MVRYGVPLILGCLYLAGAVWLVRNEGMSYREELQRARLTADAGAGRPAGKNAEVEPGVGANAGPAAVPIQIEPAPAPSIPVRELVPEPKIAKEKAAPAMVASSNPPLTAVAPRTEPRPNASPPPTGRAADISRWKNDPFWSQAYLARSWNLDDFKPEDERQLGEQLNSLILQLNPEDRGADRRRVTEAAKPFLKQVARKDVAYRFFVLNSEVANAFSHPGGYVYISRKLLDMIPEDEESLLEFVIGHEIAHVDLQHALLCLRDRGVRSFSDGTLQKLYFLIIPYGYPDKLEYDADAWVYQRMKRLQRSEHDCLNFLRILDTYAKTHDFANGRGKPEELLKEKEREPEGVRGISPIDNHLRSHPAAYDRLSRLKELSTARRK